MIDEVRITNLEEWRLRRGVYKIKRGMCGVMWV